MTNTPEQAIAWAQVRVGSTAWDNLCLSFVRQSFGIDYVGDWPTSARNAGTAWDRAQHKHRTSDPLEIPRGVPVFFELATEADHVVLSLGDGWCYSNDFVVDGRIDKVRIADIAARWGRLLGWTEDLVGNRVWTPPPPEPKTHTDLTLQWTALQFGDSPAQKLSDVGKIFGRRKHILGGSEGTRYKELLEAAADAHGYRLHMAREEWIAVSRKLVTDNWAEGYVSVLQSTDGTGRHSDRGIPWVAFDTKDLGRITAGVGHWLKDGRTPGQPNFDENERMARGVGKWGREKGAGSDLVFYMADVNRVDRISDVMSGQPFETGWDELGHHENTGHGNIDVIASFVNDSRVEAKMIRALDDTELHLHSDHFLVEARYRVRHLK